MRACLLVVLICMSPMAAAAEWYEGIWGEKGKPCNLRPEGETLNMVIRRGTVDMYELSCSIRDRSPIRNERESGWALSLLCQESGADSKDDYDLVVYPRGKRGMLADITIRDGANRRNPVQYQRCG